MLKDAMDANEQANVNDREILSLKANFPQCFDAAGNFDLTLFNELIASKEVSVKKEGYALNFLGKSYARYLSNLDSETVIVPDEGNKGNPSENVYIVGDNLDALQHLKYSYYGAIKCVYIDPPYNTGSDGFIYNDKFEFTPQTLAEKIGIDEDEAERILKMQGKSTHSAWLTFMYPRLEIARDLLKDNGVIFISIDENEFANCKLLCDSIFGEGNFVDTLHWKKKKQPSFLATHTAKIMEYVLVYAKNKDLLEKLSISETSDVTKKVINVSNAISKRHFNKGVLVKLPGSGIIPKGNYKIKTMEVEYLNDIYYSDGKSTNDVDVLARFSASQDKIDDFIKNHLLFITKNKGLRRYLSTEEFGKRKSIVDLLLSEYGDNQEGENDFLELFNDSYFDYTKPVALIKNLIKSNFTEGEIVLDFFAGTGTTAQAIYELNIEQEVDDRKFILVQLNENLDLRLEKNSNTDKENIKKLIGFLDTQKRPHSLEQVAIERMLRAAAKLQREEPEKSKNIDLGFKTYYLKKPDKNTLDKIKEFNPLLPLNSGDIIAAFGKDTIIETWKIKDGYGFNAKAEEIDLNGYTAYYINDGVHGANLYLLNEITEAQSLELVRKIEAADLVIDKIIEYGYAISFTANTSLRTNLKTLKNRNPIDVVIRY